MLYVMIRLKSVIHVVPFVFLVVSGAAVYGLPPRPIFLFLACSLALPLDGAVWQHRGLVGMLVRSGT